MYKVVRAFFDSQNDNHLYKVGDTFPVKGAKASDKRIKELAKGTNANRKVYIVEVKEDAPQTPQQTNEGGNADGGNAPQNNENGVNEGGNAPQNPEE